MMKHTFKILTNILIIIYFFSFLLTTFNTFAQNIPDKSDIKKAEQIAIKHSEYMIKRNFLNAIKLMLPSDLKQIEKDIVMILNEGKEYGIIFPFYSEMNCYINQLSSTYSDGSVLIRYYESAYGKETKDYHQKVIKSLKILETTVISNNSVKIKYSFDVYGTEEPVNLEYEKTLFYENGNWYVTKDLPVGRMVRGLKNRLESKRKSLNNK